MIIKTSKGDLPIKYGFNALAKFGDIAGLSMNDVMELDLKKMKLSDLMAFIYVGFLYGAKASGEECKIKDVDDVGELIDTEGPGLISDVMNAFAEMTPKGEGDKKK